MQQQLFEQAPLKPEFTCNTCEHRQRWQCNSKVFQYCGVRKSNLTNNGLLKIKCKDAACPLTNQKPTNNNSMKELEEKKEVLNEKEVMYYTLEKIPEDINENEKMLLEFTVNERIRYVLGSTRTKRHFTGFTGYYLKRISEDETASLRSELEKAKAELKEAESEADNWETAYLKLEAKTNALQADIRNKLGPVSNLVSLIEKPTILPKKLVLDEINRTLVQVKHSIEYLSNLKEGEK